jgi:hypothetical protein
MTKKEFLKAVSNGKEDIIQIFLDALTGLKANYCVIGGLAVNAYAEPIVSLDLDVIVAVKDIEAICKRVESYFKIERFTHSVNLNSDKSDLRIQLQIDPRYEDFLDRAEVKNILGYEMNVACVEDVLQGKLWAYSDEERRKSKRQKDLADIVRIIEEVPSLTELVPESVKKRLE